jgi:rubredoxin
MPLIASYDDVKVAKKQREIPGGYAWRTDFLKPPEGVKDHPMAFLAEGTANRVIKPHFHEVDQFQVIVSGGGVLGRHDLSLKAVHFTRAHTPYGPLTAAEKGLGFLTLRAHWDPGAQYLPEKKDKLVAVKDRKPWQATELPQFNLSNDLNVHTFSDIKDERGLAAYSMTLKPGVQTNTPDASQGNGQYLIVTKGSLTYQNKEYKSISIGFTRPHEGTFPITAGPEGVEVLVLNFPRLEMAQAVVPDASKNQGFKVWQCLLCAFSYDEALGLPHEGIAAGTRWEDVPEDWICPDCATGKSDFDMVVVAQH